MSDPVLRLLRAGKRRVRAGWTKSVLKDDKGRVCVRGGLLGERNRWTKTTEHADQLLAQAAAMAMNWPIDFNSHVNLNNAGKTRQRHALGLYDWAIWLRREELRRA